MVDVGSTGLGYTFAGSFGLFVVCLLIFEYYRRRLPDVFYWRNVARQHPEYANLSGVPLGCAPLPGRFWIPAVIRYKSETLEKTHGLDIAMYLRFLLTQMKLFAIYTLFTAVTLFPIYGTATNKNLSPGDANRATGIAIVSLANVSSKDSRLWAVFVVDVLVVIIYFSVVAQDMRYFAAARRKYRAQFNPANYTVLVFDIPSDSCSEDAVLLLLDRVVPGEVVGVRAVHDARKLLKIKRACMNAFIKKEAALETDQRLVKGSSSSEYRRHTRKAREIDHWQKRELDLYNTAHEADSDLDASHLVSRTNAAFVVFRSKRAASIASQVQVWSSSRAWRMRRASEPEDVNWNSVVISSRSVFVRYLLAEFAIVAITIVWFVPITAIQALSNFSALSKVKGFEFLASFIKNSPRLASFVEGTLPALVLFLLNYLIPIIFRFILQWTRVHSITRLDAKVRNHLFLFYTGMIFLTNAIVGSVFGILSSLLTDFSTRELVSLLSSSVPKQAVFFMKYVLLNTFLGASLNLLNFGRLILHPFLIIGARSERQVLRANGSLADFPIFKLYAIGMLVSLICTVYSTIAPLICCIATCYFGLIFICTKHTLMYGDMHLHQGGGYLFRGACSGVLVGVYIRQLILSGIFYLKGMYVLASLEVLLALFSIRTGIVISRRLAVVMKHGALVDQLNMDDPVPDEDDRIARFLDYYVHPGLRPIQKDPVLGRPYTSGDDTTL